MGFVDLVGIAPNYVKEDLNLNEMCIRDRFDLWRGQTLKSFYVTLPGGSHNVTIKALDDLSLIHI